MECSVAVIEVILHQLIRFVPAIRMLVWAVLVYKYH